MIQKNLGHPGAPRMLKSTFSSGDIEFTFGRSGQLQVPINLGGVQRWGYPLKCMVFICVYTLENPRQTWMI